MRRIVLAGAYRLHAVGKQRFVERFIQLLVNRLKRCHAVRHILLQLACHLDLVVLDVLGSNVIPSLKRHLHQCGFVLAQVQVCHLLTHGVHIVRAVCNRLVDGRKILVIQLFGLVAVVLSENVVAVALHCLTAVRTGNLLILGKLRNGVRHFLGIQRHGLTARPLIVLDWLHPAVQFLLQLIPVHDGCRIVALAERVRCAIHHSGLQQLLILGGKRVVLLELLDLLVYRSRLLPRLAQLGGLYRAHLFVIIVMQERALFCQLVLQLTHRLFPALAVHLIVTKRFNFCIAILRIWGYTVIRSHLSMSAAPKGGVGRAVTARMISFLHKSNAVRGIRIAIDRPIRIDALRELLTLSLRPRLHHGLFRCLAVLHRLGERNRSLCDLLRREAKCIP